MPWTERKLDAVLDAADAVEASTDQEKESLRDLLPHLLNKTPRTDAAALRATKLLAKLEGAEKRVLANALREAADAGAVRSMGLRG